MKITDNLGRSVDVALVAKPQLADKFSGGLDWVRPLTHEIENSNKIFVRMPEGQFGLRIMSKHRTEILMHVEGRLVARSDVASGMQFIDKDKSGSFFVFTRPGKEKPLHPASDHQPEESDNQGEQALLFGENSDAHLQSPLLPPAERGLVFVVLRFVEDAGPGLKPPPQEFEITLQMDAPANYDLLVGKHLLTMVKPEPLINGDDEVSFEPSQANRPSFTCTCTGHVEGSR